MKIIRKIIYPLTIIIVLIILIFILYIRKYLLNNQYEEINIESNIIKEEPQVKEEVKTEYTVDIKGAIKNPGVYTVDCNSNVNDQTCTIMIQKLNLLFARNPLNIKGI